MRKIASLALVAVLAVSVEIGTAFAGETVTYRGTGTFVATRTLMPLANGGAAIHLSNQVVATIAPSEPGFIFGDCAGLGYLSPDSAYEVHVFCTFTETGNDSFDVKGEGGVKGGGVEIIGGSGKWMGATGTGTFTRKWADGPRGSFDYEFHITTP